MFDTLKRCWTIAPTSEQIIEDILGFPEILTRIINEEGCVIPDEDLRTDRRARYSSGVKHPSSFIILVKISGKPKISSTICSLVGAIVQHRFNVSNTSAGVPNLNLRGSLIS